MEWKCKICTKKFSSLNVIEAERQLEVIKVFIEHLQKYHTYEVTNINETCQKISMIALSYTITRLFVVNIDEESKKCQEKLDTELFNLLGIPRLPNLTGRLEGASIDSNT